MTPKSTPKSASKSKSNQNPHYKPGLPVEIMSNEEGFRGSFYTGIVLKATKTPNFTVQYDKLFEDEEGTIPLKETVSEYQIRPVAPRERKRKFKFSEEVDAFHNDGWWEGVITEECEDGKFAVFFRSTKEQIEFGEEDLRLHREWVNEEWKPRLEGDEKKEEEVEKEEVKEKGNEGSRKKRKLFEEDKEEVSKEVKKKVNEKEEVAKEVKKKVNEGNKRKLFEEDKEEVAKEVKKKVNEKEEVAKEVKKKVNEKEEVAKEVKQKVNEKVPSKKEEKPIESGKDEFREGMLVEVSSDEDGFRGAWFAATVVEPVGKDKYLIEYHSLRNEDDSDFLREEIDDLHIRPPPPREKKRKFKLNDGVDAFYNDGWWEGVITKLCKDGKFSVYFSSDERIEFGDKDLRLHREWVKGKWNPPLEEAEEEKTKKEAKERGNQSSRKKNKPVEEDKNEVSKEAQKTANESSRKKKRYVKEDKNEVSKEVQEVVNESSRKKKKHAEEDKTEVSKEVQESSRKQKKPVEEDTEVSKESSRKKKLVEEDKTEVLKEVRKMINESSRKKKAEEDKTKLSKEVQKTVNESSKKKKKPVEEDKKEVLKESSRKKKKTVKEDKKEMSKEEVPYTTESNPIKSEEDEFGKGKPVEVCNDEDGFKGAWFAATIIKPVGKDKYLIEYQSLRTDDDTDFLREEVDTLHLRPSPPLTIVVDRFKKLEEVDAFLNDAWWVGVISKVNTFPKYLVYFRDSDEELEFQHNDLRPHQDWINGKWVIPSRSLKL